MASARAEGGKPSQLLTGYRNESNQPDKQRIGFQITGTFLGMSESLMMSTTAFAGASSPVHLPESRGVFTQVGWGDLSEMEVWHCLFSLSDVLPHHTWRSRGVPIRVGKSWEMEVVWEGSVRKYADIELLQIELMHMKSSWKSSCHMNHSANVTRAMPVKIVPIHTRKARSWGVRRFLCVPL